jgi:CrcB protein
MSDPDRCLPGPPHRRLADLLWVWLGGAAGTAARFLLSRAVPEAAGLPVGIFAVNVAGAFVLGLLLERLVLAGSDVGRRRWLRLFLGTGFLGGFTTYSALALDSADLLAAGLTLPAAAYAVGTVLVGAGASVAGIAVGTRTGRR